MDSHDLRRRAEERLGPEPEIMPATSSEELRRLVHELRTHQIELEMQNEELRLAHEELVEARDRYTDLFDFAPVGYAITSSKGLVLEANLTLTELLGVERRSLLKRRLSAFILPDDQDIHYRHVRDLLETGRRQTWEMRLRRRSGDVFWAGAEGVPLEGPDGETRLRMVVTDITERKRVEEGLRYRDLFENSPIGLWEEDFSAVREYIDRLRAEGIEDYERYFSDRPEALAECAPVSYTHLRAHET